MCEPTTLVALAAMAVGTGLQYKANREKQNDMRKLQRSETERQDGYYKNAEQNMLQNRDSYTREHVEGAMDAAAGERQAQYAKAEANAPRANETAAGASGGNQVVNDAFARALANAQGEATQAGEKRSQLASFADALGEKAIENNQRTGNIGMYGSFAQGSSNVLPLELNHAMTKQRSKALWGSVLQSVGGAMLGGAGAGLGGAAGAGAGSAVGAGAGAASGAMVGGSSLARPFASLFSY